MACPLSRHLFPFKILYLYKKTREKERDREKGRNQERKREKGRENEVNPVGANKDPSLIFMLTSTKEAEFFCVLRLTQWQEISNTLSCFFWQRVSCEQASHNSLVDIHPHAHSRKKLWMSMNIFWHWHLTINLQKLRFPKLVHQIWEKLSSQVIFKCHFFAFRLALLFSGWRKGDDQSKDVSLMGQTSFGRCKQQIMRMKFRPNLIHSFPDAFTFLDFAWRMGSK